MRWVEHPKLYLHVLGAVFASVAEYNTRCRCTGSIDSRGCRVIGCINLRIVKRRRSCDIGLVIYDVHDSC